LTNALQIEKAQAFLAMHQGHDILVLPNAWDTGSAVMFAAAGFAAIGTTSAGVAYSFGYPDGEVLPRELLLDFVRRTAARVSQPLTVDIEEGFGTAPDQIAKFTGQIVECGAVGVNLEDAFANDSRTLTDIQAHCEIVRAAAAQKQVTGIPFVLNARVNTHWYPVSSTTSLLDQAIERCNHFLEAGADCAFVPGVSDPSEISTLVREVDGPINILTSAACPDVSALNDLGVARISLGSGPARAMLGRTQDIIDELKTQGRFDRIFECSIDYHEANRCFARDV